MDRRTPALVALIFGSFLSTTAHADREFELRFTTNERGDITIVGNTLMTCSEEMEETPGMCAAARMDNRTSNNAFDPVVFVDIDGESSTYNSSSADLELPPSSEVLYAALYWGGDAPSNPPADMARSVLFKAPGSATYETLAASTFDMINERFAGSLDVTDKVRSAGNGTYTVANVLTDEDENTAGGWALVVAYRDLSAPARNLAIFDGYDNISQAMGDATINLAGFLTPLSGTVRTHVGVVAHEGDAGGSGDRARLAGMELTDALNTPANVFNSTINHFGEHFEAKNPNYRNQLGFDIDLIAVEDYLATGATSTSIELTTNRDSYYPWAVSFATELYVPIINGSKEAVDLNGGSIRPGDELEYVLRLVNDGQDLGRQLVLEDVLPEEVDYVPGSLTISEGAGMGALTDAAGDDAGEYIAAERKIVVRMGTGASATMGGSLAFEEAVTLRFRVTVDPAIEDESEFSNQATYEYVGETLGEPQRGQSDGDVVLAGATPTISKVTRIPVVLFSKSARLEVDMDGDGLADPGDEIAYAMVLTNEGDGDAEGVRFTDEIDPNFTILSANTSVGSITSAAGESPITADIGGIPAGGEARVTVRVRVNDDIAPSVTELSNQASIVGDNVPMTLSDDPSLPGSTDATVFPADSGCLTNMDCPPEQPVCTDGVCGPCESNDDCPDAQPICLPDGSCGSCQSDSDCGGPMSGRICDREMCIDGCGFDADRNKCPAELECTATAPGTIGVCEPPGGTACRTDDDCRDPARPFCFEMRCVPCRADADCAGNERRTLCEIPPNECVECTPTRFQNCSPDSFGAACLETNLCGCNIDADCSIGRVCDLTLRECMDAVPPDGAGFAGGAGCSSTRGRSPAAAFFMLTALGVFFARRRR